MWACKKCEALADEVRALRNQNATLIDRLTAIADVRAYQAVTFDTGGNNSDYHGGGKDELRVYDEYGSPVLLTEVEV